MRASINQVASPVRYPRAETSIREPRVMLNRIFLIGAMVGILLAHAVVFTKLIQGSAPVTASRLWPHDLTKPSGEPAFTFHSKRKTLKYMRNLRRLRHDVASES